jgi:hypothetical protein
MACLNHFDARQFFDLPTIMLTLTSGLRPFQFPERQPDPSSRLHQRIFSFYNRRHSLKRFLARTSGKPGRSENRYSPVNRSKK